MYDLQPAGFLKWCLRLPSEYEQSRRENTLLWHGIAHICPKITTRSSFNANSILFLSLHRIRFPPAIKRLQKRDTIEMATQPTERLGCRLKPSLALTPQPLSAFRRAAPRPASPCKRRGPRRGGAGAPPGAYRGPGLPGTSARGPDRGGILWPRRAMRVKSRQGEPAPSGRCSPSCPSTAAPAGRCAKRDRPPRALPSRRACGECFRAAPRPPPPPAPAFQAGPGSPRGTSGRAARAGPPPRAGRAAGGGDGQCDSQTLPPPPPSGSGVCFKLMVAAAVPG